MIKVENECVGCPPEMGCIGSACRYSRVLYAYCDECGEEITEDYAFRAIGSDECLCEECAEKQGAFDDEGNLNEEEFESFDWASDYDSNYDDGSDWAYEQYRDEQLDFSA